MAEEKKECEWWCAALHKPHKGPCFEMYSHRDVCPGPPDCVHDEKEVVLIGVAHSTKLLKGK